MRVIPVQSRRLIVGNLEAVFEGRSRLDQRLQRFVLMAHRRNHQSVKMQIGCRGLPSSRPRTRRARQCAATA